MAGEQPDPTAGPNIFGMHLADLIADFLTAAVHFGGLGITLLGGISITIRLGQGRYAAAVRGFANMVMALVALAVLPSLIGANLGDHAMPSPTDAMTEQLDRILALLSEPVVACAIGSAGLVAACTGKFRTPRRRSRSAHPTRRLDGAAALRAQREERQQIWAAACDKLNQLRRDYADFEIDPASLLDRPLLADVDEPLTADFHTAFAHAQDLETDTAPTQPAAVEEFEHAVTAARDAFVVADAHARRQARHGVYPGGVQLSAHGLGQVDTARKSVVLAMHPSTPPAEADAALGRARAVLEAVGVTMPDALRATWTRALEAKPTQVALPPSPRQSGSVSAEATTEPHRDPNPVVGGRS